MRLLFECTYVYDHPLVNSGIQRVVRNVIKHLGASDPGVECVPVILRSDGVYRVNRLAPTLRERWTYRVQEVYERTRNRYWLLHHRAELALGLQRFPWARRVMERCFRLVSLFFVFCFVAALLVLEPGRLHLRLRPWFERTRNRYWLRHQTLENYLHLHRRRALRYAVYQLARLGSLSHVLPWRLARLIGAAPQDDARASRLMAQAGDVLVLLDSSWHSDFFALTEKLKSEGVGIVAVVYDLIPLTHPQFCDENLVRVFDHWFGWVARTADGFVAISQTISEQVRQDVSRRMGPQAGALKWHGYFRLGSDLDQGQTSGLVRKPVLSMFSQGLPVYLMVSTIEPRKNHVYLVNAFEKIWANGGQVALCIVGKVGWKCAELVHRITQHPELGKRLFMFNDLSDTELERCYQQSRALVFPSFVEGFGLPLVEAMQRGLPAFASDIAVFREVGGEFLAYFDIGDPASLAHSVLAFESSGQFPAQKPVSDWAWPGWKESAQELVRVISSHAHRHQR